VGEGAGEGERDAGGEEGGRGREVRHYRVPA